MNHYINMIYYLWL